MFGWLFVCWLPELALGRPRITQRLCVCGVCVCVFTQATLCTTTMVYGVLVHHQGAICTMVHKGHYIFWKIQGTLIIFRITGISHTYEKLVVQKVPSYHLRVAHKEHTSVWVICRLSTYVCVSVCYHSQGWKDRQGQGHRSKVKVTRSENVNCAIPLTSENIVYVSARDR